MDSIARRDLRILEPRDAEETAGRVQEQMAKVEESERILQDLEARVQDILERAERKLRRLRSTMFPPPAGSAPPLDRCVRVLPAHGAQERGDEGEAIAGVVVIHRGLQAMLLLACFQRNMGARAAAVKLCALLSVVHAFAPPPSTHVLLHKTRAVAGDARDAGRLQSLIHI